MKKFIVENKFVSAMIAFLFTSLITYSVLLGQWTVDKIYSQDAKIMSHVNVQISEEKTVSRQIQDVKDDVKGIKEDIAVVKREAGEEGVKLRKDIADNQKELLKLLIDIKRNK